MPTITGTTLENNPTVLLGQAKDNNGVYCTQANTSAITIKVFNRTTETQVGSTINAAVANTIFDTLQTTDARWTKDRTGYNFAYTLPPSYMAEGNAVYRVEILFTPVVGWPWRQCFDIRTENIFSE